LAAAAAALACGPSEPPGPAAARRTAPAARAPERAAPPAAGPHVLVARAADGTLRVRARDAARFQVMQELGRAAGFATRAGATPVPPRRLDLELAGASVERALAAVLGDVPHTLHYEPSPAGGTRLASVTVGRTPSPGDEARQAPSEVPASAAPADPLAPEAGREPAPTPAELPERIDALARDPSADARRRAAAALGAVEGGEAAFLAVDALLAALGDPDPSVVAAAVRALEEIHDVLPDPRIRAAVGPLTGHRDPRVRAAAESFREWTEEDEP
jgi:hypothetical protein